MKKISAYINFNNNNCREAMTFYKECLGGDLSLIVVKESPMASMFPESVQDTILHADLKLGEFNLLGSDMQDTSVKEKTGGQVSLTLTVGSKAEMQEVFSKLAERGSVTHEPSTFFAGTMGNVVDRFGIRWGVFTDEK
ncbi:VOC family protein [Mucilaginibacter sp.]|uniref:VOC family protein n=1 Tax=Mucilaginibacter sp. TaxID=1882438 RepID=UPI0035BC5037